MVHISCGWRSAAGALRTRFHPLPCGEGQGGGRDGNGCAEAAKESDASGSAILELIEPLRLSGFHFRKQVALGPYVVDFACHHAKVVVEIVGDSHYEDAAIDGDKVRDQYLYGRGYRVVRFINLDVMDNPDGVYETLTSVLAEPPSLPSPQGGG